MQEMYDQLKASKKDGYGLAFAIDMLLENEEAMLEKERKVIEDAFENGQRRGQCEWGGLLGDFYYDEAFTEDGKSYGLVSNETFNTKEK